ncbi:Uncharacterized protein Rumeso_02541 [Rubellimicrobium mesophilum DSM 19309]|uniref:ABM domain-containing protein n=1 Tax=Rubellimicrobium mesophilum DSM 19309 TaxID=442562 RepID=A0A017HP27_9RHOB|nr:antibiotic biosynthesis monooxygenase [Rubellimicrobium mesophilum]EYD75923.1 Uncharacterized protein Rumeso_02541 [Rubellimicrobium mesophilum DSM 19309]
MEASNVVRFRVKAGHEDEFIRLHEDARTEEWPGLRSAYLVRTGERTFCFVGEWDSMEALASGRPAMIAELDRFRGILEDLGGGLGVTDPVSGEIVLRLRSRAGQDMRAMA